MKKYTYVGLDVHQHSIVIAAARGRAPGEVIEKIGNDWHALVKVLDRLGNSQRLKICYEAGPTGYHLARNLSAAGYACMVVAPSLIPVQPGRRVKTDRRDARRLAELHRAGELVEVAIPERQTEAMRDLERAREDAKNAERVVRHQLDKFLLRHGRIWSQGDKWTKKHQAWIAEQEFAEEALRRVKADYLRAVEEAGERIARLDADIKELVEKWQMKPVVEALQALRGVQLLTAVVLAAEVGDYSRFVSPRKVMGFLGMVPSESSSGQRRHQGRITRTGNKHVRRILTQASWCYRFTSGVSKTIRRRRALVSPEVRAIAERADERLRRRYRRLVEKGKCPQKVVMAVGRELAGFVWAIARQVQGATAATAVTEKQRPAAQPRRVFSSKGETKIPSANRQAVAAVKATARVVPAGVVPAGVRPYPELMPQAEARPKQKGRGSTRTPRPSPSLDRVARQQSPTKRTR